MPARTYSVWPQSYSYGPAGPHVIGRYFNWGMRFGLFIVLVIIFKTIGWTNWNTCDNAADWKAYPDWPAGHVVFSVNSVQRTEGSTSIRMDYTTKQSEWHNAVYCMNFTPPLNWSNYQGITFDIYNPDPWPKKLELTFTNSSGQRFYARKSTNFSDDNYSALANDYIDAGPKWSRQSFSFDNPHFNSPNGNAFSRNAWSDIRKLSFALVPPKDVKQSNDEQGHILMDNYTFVPLNEFQLQTPLTNGMSIQYKRKIKLWGTGMPSRTVSATMKRDRDGAIIRALTCIIDNNGYWMIPLYELDTLVPSDDKYRLDVSDGSSSSSIVDLMINKAELTVPSVISSNMVLQQGQPNKLWGKGGPGNTVLVELRREADDALLQRRTCSIDSNGNWHAILDPISASFTKYKITLEDPSRVLVLNNILFGEVWVAAGQSNMDLGLQYIVGHSTFMTNAHNQYLRIFNQAKGMGLTTDLGDFSQEPLFDVSDGIWQTGESSASLSKMDVSGIGYTFALALFDYFQSQHRDVPVAFHNTACGATSIHAWLSREKTESDPLLNARYPATWTMEKGNASFDQATGMYNHKIGPLTNLTIRGILWSQGENNVGNAEAAAYYRVALKALADDWRMRFSGESKPFIVAQLAPHFYYNDRIDCAGIREAQFETCDSLPISNALAIHDVSLFWDDPVFAYRAPIHPLDKAPVGQRMALIARALAYGDAVEYSGPQYSSINIDNNRAIITFTHIAEGLKAKGNEELKGFCICGPDRVFLPARAEIVSTSSVAVWSSQVSNPVAVTYGYTDMNDFVNLMNSSNLPATPFRSDKTPSIYFHPEHWMNCDSATFWLNANTIAGEMPNWTISSKQPTGQPVFTIDQGRKLQGTGSLRIAYTSKSTDGHTIGFSPQLAPGRHDWHHFKGLRFQFYNPDAWSKQLTVYIKNVAGAWYVLRDATRQPSDSYGYSDIPAGPGWFPLCFYLDDLHQGDHPETSAGGASADDVAEVHFVLKPLGTQTQADDFSGFIQLDAFEFFNTDKIQEDFKDAADGFDLSWDPPFSGTLGGGALSFNSNHEIGKLENSQTTKGNETISCIVQMTEAIPWDPIRQRYIQMMVPNLPAGKRCTVYIGTSLDDFDYWGFHWVDIQLSNGTWDNIFWHSAGQNALPETIDVNAALTNKTVPQNIKVRIEVADDGFGAGNPTQVNIDWMRLGIAADAEAPGIPGFIGPSDGTVASNPPTFQWSAPSGFTSGTYTLTYSQDPSFSNATTKTLLDQITTTSYTPSARLSSGQWYWMVCATNVDHISGKMLRKASVGDDRLPENRRFYSFNIESFSSNSSWSLYDNVF